MNADSDIADIVRGIRGFGGLDEPGVAALASAATLMSLAEGAVVYEQDEDSYDVYFIVSGLVAIRASLPGSGGGRRATDPELIVLRSGAFFGVYAFLDGARRDMNAVARERSLVLRFDGPLLKAACEAEPRVGRTAYELFGKAAARNARDISMELRTLMAERA